MSLREIKTQITRLMAELEAMAEERVVDKQVLRIKIAKLRRLLEQSEGLSR